jgi:transcriptional regulator with XRE-family HTH domain
MSTVTGNELKTVFRENLIRRRQELGLSQKALAERMSKLHPAKKKFFAPYISDLECGVKTPTLETQAILAEALEMEPKDLLSPR